MEILIFLSIFILLTAGSLVLFSINPFSYETYISLSERIAQEKVSLLSPKKITILERISVAISQTIKHARITWTVFWCYVGVAFICGLILGSFLFGDILLAIVTGLCVMPLTYIFFTVKSRWYKRAQDEMLENTLSIITNSYIGCDDIIKAVSDNLQKIDLSEPFAEFIAEVMLIDSSIERGLKRLELKIKNRYFSEWVDVLILSQKNREMKLMLPAIVEGMNDAKRLQLEADTVMMNIWKEYFLSVILVFSIIPLLKFSNDEWFAILTNTFIGKLLILVMLVLSVISAFIVMKINKPL